MTLKKRGIITILFLIVNYTYSQDNISVTANLESPEEEFFFIFQEKPLSNPIYLNGKIEKVKKSIIQHITPETEIASQENYDYTLNKQKEVIQYASNLEFDEMNPRFFNLEKQITIKGDSIINNENICYTFNNGKLITITEKIAEVDVDIVEDSTFFRYKNDKLIEFKNYRRDIAEEISDFSNNSYNEYNIIASDYQIKNYGKAKYSESNLLEFKLDIFSFDETIFTNKTSYKYNAQNKLESFTRSTKEYVEDFFDIYEYIKNEEKYISKIKPIAIKKYSENYKYDNKNRITELIINTSKGTKNIYNVEYKKDSVILNYFNKGILKKQYYYIYDKHKNPIQEQVLKYINDKMYVDTTTILDITYY